MLIDDRELFTVRCSQSDFLFLGKKGIFIKEIANFIKVTDIKSFNSTSTAIVLFLQMNYVSVVTVLNFFC